MGTVGGVQVGAGDEGSVPDWGVVVVGEGEERGRESEIEIDR